MLAGLPLAAEDKAVAATAAVLVVGGLFVLAAALRLGGLTSLISRPVLRGFAFGIAVTIILRQVPVLVGAGYTAVASNAVNSMAVRSDGTLWTWGAGGALLRPELVIEVGYDHMEGERFRHTAQLKRWRPDRDPLTCGYDQLEEPVSYDLADVLAGRVR